jgi:hypothetical protein
MNTTEFKVSSNGECKSSPVVPEQKAIQTLLASAKKKPLQSNAVVIARYAWLTRNKLNFPKEMDMPNLCLTIKNGKLIRAIFSNVLTHVIKKQKYHIQVLN